MSVSRARDEGKMISTAYTQQKRAYAGLTPLILGPKVMPGGTGLPGLHFPVSKILYKNPLGKPS